jgi:hypothetical protein
MTNQFIEIPASKRSLALRKPIYGIGTNDADYMVDPRIDGKRGRCPIYRVWKSMLERCYSEKRQAKCPTYIGCTVCKEWLTFSNFRRWMVNQDWQGKQLDKDILVKGNKIYSAETCCFVTQAVNMIESRAKHYKFISPVGENVDVYNLSEFCRTNGLHQSHMSQVHLGRRKQHKGWLSTNKEK